MEEEHRQPALSPCSLKKLFKLLQRQLQGSLKFVHTQKMINYLPMPTNPNIVGGTDRNGLNCAFVLIVML